MTGRPLDDDFIGLIDVLDMPLTVRGMKIAFRQFCKRCGFDQYALANIWDGRLSVLSNYSQEWVDQYTSSDHLRVDPVVAIAKRGLHPFNWSTKEMTGQVSHVARFAKEALAFGIRSGFSVPIRVGFGGTTILTLASDRPDADAVFLNEPTYALTATALAHSKFAQLIDSADTGIAVGLSPREATCLKWSSLGKTKADTATLTGLSDKTVRFYLDRAMIKLGARNVTQAVAIAVAKRLI
jgi:LuxR family transcriptional activator of conjugal transfer of Ti plasmids